jgi:hypothetical protein
MRESEIIAEAERLLATTHENGDDGYVTRNDMRKKGQLPKGAGAGAKSIAVDLESIEL